MTDPHPPFDNRPLNERLDINFALKSAGLGVWELDPLTNLVLWDDRCRALFGLATDNQLPFEQAIHYIHPQDVTRVTQAVEWAQNPASGGAYDVTYRTIGADDGLLRWVRFWGQSYFTPAGELLRFAGVAQEVTQQVMDKQQIKDSEEILWEMVRQAPIGICLLNAPDLVAESVNDSFLEVAGKPYEVIMGKHYWEPFAEVASYYEPALNQVVETGEAYYANEVEMVLIRHGQPETIYVTFAYIPLKDRAGRVQKVAVWVLENTFQVTQRKKVEQLVDERTQALHVANDELAEANRLLIRSNTNLEKFAYVASHDLQEPLRKIQQFGDLLKARQSSLSASDSDYIDRMQVAASRMATLIRDLLAYSRLSARQISDELVPLKEIVQQVLTTFDLVIAETNATITVAPLPTIQGDKTQFTQLFQNLISNALKFRQPMVAPVIRITAHTLLVSELPVPVNPVRAVQHYHRIEVADNGIGFDEQYVDRIFEVFQRLHGRNEFAGTGIGLAICERVVANHGGAITASSRPGQGATFTIYLPVTV
ncbi:sensor histidine kinase [Spirosoma koreense]